MSAAAELYTQLTNKLGKDDFLYPIPESTEPDTRRLDFLETLPKRIRCETEGAVAHMEITISQDIGVKDSPCSVRTAIDSAINLQIPASEISTLK